MLNKNYSILRFEEYRNISEVQELNGRILDVGGSKKSGYRKLFRGDIEYYTINIDTSCEPDMVVDIETKFPFDDDSFDHAICFNVLEHVYEFEHVVSETHRTMKSGGKYVIAVPFMYYRHGSPDDFFRYTESALRHLLEKQGFNVLKINPLGRGFFSLGFQIAGGFIPTNVLRQLFKHLSLNLDNILRFVSKRYRSLAHKIPLGYFVIAQKK